MAHPIGERLRCNVCGAEIEYIQACPCPESEDKLHPTICCDEAMQTLGVMPRAEVPQPTPPPASH